MTVSGTFDAATVAAVQDWQARNGIPVDVDATLTVPTWETLVPELDQHAAGLPVTAVQEILAKKGYATSPSPAAYDHATRRAVQDLQALHGLPRNGKLSTSTWCTIVGGNVRQSFRHH